MPFSKRALRFSSEYLLAFALAFSAITVPRDLTHSTAFFILTGNVPRSGWKINIFFRFYSVWASARRKDSIAAGSAPIATMDANHQLGALRPCPLKQLHADPHGPFIPVHRVCAAGPFASCCFWRPFWQTVGTAAAAWLNSSQSCPIVTMHVQRAFSSFRRLAGMIAASALAAGETAELSVLVPRTRGNLILGYRQGQTELKLR